VTQLLHLAQQCGSHKLLPPRAISQLTNVSRREIYRLKEGSKRQSTRILKHKDPALVKLIGEIIVARGLRTLSLDTVMKELAAKGQYESVGRSTVRLIMRQQLGLRYKRMDSALIRYDDQTFDEKRLWVCRILA